MDVEGRGGRGVLLCLCHHLLSTPLFFGVLRGAGILSDPDSGVSLVGTFLCREEGVVGSPS